MASGWLEPSVQEFDTLSTPQTDIGSPKGGNNRPGKAFWLVLIVIGCGFAWQKSNPPPKPVTGVSTGQNGPRSLSLELSALAHSDH